MDNYNEVDVQNVDNEAADVMTDCLRNPVVLQNILEHFSSVELRQLSFVNKLWKCEARSVMRNRGQFTAFVQSLGWDQNHPQKEVDAFISDLQQTNPVPFSGISIYIDFHGHFGPIPAVDCLQGVVLGQPSLKTVSVHLSGSWLDNVTSPGILLTKKILQDCSGVLQELELRIDGGQEYFMEQVVQHFVYPRLKILKLRDFLLSDGVAYQNYMKAIISRAPNLKVLHSNSSLKSMLSVLEGSSVTPVYGHVVAPFEGISENIFSAIKFENVSLEYSGPDFNFERFNRITPMLLQQCCTTTLHSMRLDSVLAIPLMTYGVRLKNVKKLFMDIDYSRLEHIEPRILRIVKNFNFSHIFPNLNKASIDSDSSMHDLSPDHMSAIIERANAVLGDPMPDRAARMKDLNIYWSPSSEAAQFSVEMFPNIKKLEIRMPSNAGGQVAFGSIWNWLELKELKITGYLLPTAGNLDSVFSGIFPEEVAELRLKDEDYLKRVNIVPVMPAVTCLKYLRTLTLHHEHNRLVPFGDDAAFMFSTVTMLIAFARMPALAVSVNIHAKEVPPAMTHLQPYVCFTSELHNFVHYYDELEDWPVEDP